MTTPTSPPPGGLTGFASKVLVTALNDPGVQKFIRALAKELLGDVIADTVVPLIPLAAAGAAKAVKDIEKDVEGAVTDVEKIGTGIIGDLNGAVPGLNIPFLGDILNIWKGFGR